MSHMQKSSPSTESKFGAVDRSLERNLESIGQIAKSLQDRHSDYSFELRSTPKKTCIPASLSDCLPNDTVAQSDSSNLDLDKSWSVLFIGKDKNVKQKI